MSDCERIAAALKKAASSQPPPHCEHCEAQVAQLRKELQQAHDKLVYLRGAIQAVLEMWQ